MALQSSAWHQNGGDLPVTTQTTRGRSSGQQARALHTCCKQDTNRTQRTPTQRNLRGHTHRGTSCNTRQRRTSPGTVRQSHSSSRRSRGRQTGAPAGARMGQPPRCARMGQPPTRAITSRAAPPRHSPHLARVVDAVRRRAVGVGHAVCRDEAHGQEGGKKHQQLRARHCCLIRVVDTCWNT